MTLLAITSFSGEMPRVAVDKLPPNAAQAALDCEFSSGDLVSAKGLGNLLKLAAGLSNPAGAFFTDDGNFFTWTGDYTAAKGTVIDDFYKRVYFTDQSPYLRVTQQQYAIAGVVGWDPGVTYALNAEVLYPMPVYPNWSSVKTPPYVQGDVVQYPTNSSILYRSLRSNNDSHQPDINATWWELWGEGKRYKSLQNGNTAKTPTEEPDWWIQNGRSLVGVLTRAGVPAPAEWTTKLFGAGTYNVNVVAADLQGLLSVYNVPQDVADARAEVDGSTTGIPNTSALIAVARPTLLDKVAIRVEITDPDNTASAYYQSNNVKIDQAKVTLYPIVKGRTFAFDPPAKADTFSEYEILQILIEEGSDSGVPTVDLEHQGA